MGWLSKIFGYVPAKEREGISFKEKTFWEVSPTENFSLFLRSLHDLVPGGSILYLEGISSNDIITYLDSRKPQQISKVAKGTIWPRAKCYHMPVTSRNLEGLAQLAEKHKALDIAFHVHVYKDKKVLLQWYDFPSDPFCISKEIPEDKIKHFCDKLNLKYKEEEYH